MYEKSEEISGIIKKLVNDRGDLFGKVPVDLITSGLRVDKESPDKPHPVLKIEGIRGQKSLATEYKYIIHGYENDWGNLDYNHKVAHVAKMLKRIYVPGEEELAELAEKGKDFEYGKLVDHDVVDFQSFIKSLGINWEDNENPIPNIIEDTAVKI